MYACKNLTIKSKWRKDEEIIYIYILNAKANVKYIPQIEDIDVNLDSLSIICFRSPFIHTGNYFLMEI
jgi:hypothetical protein